MWHSWAVVKAAEHGNTVDRTGSPEVALVVQGASRAGCARVGKIARLPVSIREEVNRRMEDGQTSASICTWLNQLPEARKIMASGFGGQPISENNISRWRSGGYLAWLSRQEALDAILLLTEETEGVQEAAKEGLTDRVALALVARLAVQLRAFERMEEGPAKAQAWRDLLGSLVLLRRGDLHAERLKAEKERFEHRKFRNAAEFEEALLRWVKVPENKARVKELVFAQEKKSTRERKKEEAERVRQMKAALGIH
jgi:hypothetical protein